MSENPEVLSRARLEVREELWLELGDLRVRSGLMGGGP